MKNEILRERKIKAQIMNDVGKLIEKGFAEAEEKSQLMREQEVSELCKQFPEIEHILNLIAGLDIFLEKKIRGKKNRQEASEAFGIIYNEIADLFTAGMYDPPVEEPEKNEAFLI